MDDNSSLFEKRSSTGQRNADMTSPPKKGTTAKTVATWTYLDWFQILTEEHHEDNFITSVFNNGNQQVPVTIILTARNSNGELHTLTASELQGLQIIDYYTSQPIESTRNRDPRFDYYSSQLPVKQKRDSKPKANQQAIHLWVIPRSSETIRIAAKITPPGSSIPFTTNTNAVAPGGAPTDGKFNSSFSIKPVTPPVYSMVDFDMVRFDATGNTEYDVDLYQISFKNPNLKIRYMRHHSGTAGHYHYCWYKDKQYKFQIAYQAGSPYVARFASPGHEYQGYIDFLVNSPDGTATAARVIDKYVSEGEFTPTHRSAQVSYFDNFGTESRSFWLNNSTDGNYIYFAEREEN
jgi:hypothetical protein